MKFSFSHLTQKFTSRIEIAQAIDTTPVEPVIVRKDFFIADLDNKTIHDIFNLLRDHTIDFALDNGLTWAATDFNLDGVPVRVKLTESYDVAYVVDGLNTFNIFEAIDMVKWYGSY